MKLALEIIKYIYENCLLTLKDKVSDSNLESFMVYIDQVIGRQEVKCIKKNKDTLKRLIKSKFGTLSKCSIHNLSSK